MSLNRCTLALAITIAIDASPQEVEETIAKVRNFFDNGIPPSEVSVSQTVSVGPSAPIGAVHAGSAIPSHEAAARDKTGLPWDERIHASTKAVNEDGTWRNRRGVDKMLLSKVEAELRSTLAAPAPVVTEGPAALPPPPAPAPLPLPPVPGANVEAPAYTQFVQFIASQSRITPDWLQATLLAYGVANGDIANLAHRLDLIDSITAGIKTALGV